MALRYWFGGTGTWDTTSTTNWSAANPLGFTASCSGTALTTTGSPALVVGMKVVSSTNVSLGTVSSGSGNSWVVSIGGTYASQSMKAATVGASVPTTADTVNFFSNSSATSAYTVTLSGALNCSAFLGSSNTPTFAGTGTLGVSGSSFTLGVGMTWSATGLITFTGSPTVTTNGVTINSPITYDAVGGTMTLADALTLGTLRSANFTNGTINLNGKTMTVLSFVVLSGVKNITFNGGALVVNGSFNNSFPTNFTTTAGTGVGTISMVGASGKNFLGGGVTFNCTLNQGGAGSLTITGSSTFNNITNTTQPASVFFTSGTTNTFNNFNLSGAAGNLITISSVTTGAQATISKASGTVSVNYCSIQDINATGGASWYAGSNSTNGGGNTGWLFQGPNDGAFFGLL